MFKKAGIIVGVTIVIIACGVYWFVGTLEDKGEGNPSPDSVSTPVNNEGTVETNNQEQEEPEQQIVGNTELIQPEPNVTPVVEYKQVFSKLDESQLGDPSLKKIEVMIVSSKNMVLMDSDFGQPNGKQLVYTADLLSGGKSYTLYLNRVGYESIDIGDSLKVEYVVYTNDIGVEFPAIINAIVLE